MSNKQDSGDEMQSISSEFRTATSLQAEYGGQSHWDDGKSRVEVAYEASEGRRSYTESGGAAGGGSPVQWNLPQVNVPEKILFVVDTVRTRDYTPFLIGDGQKFSPLHMIKRAIDIFVLNKSTMQAGHEYALIFLNKQKVVWSCEFTSNIRQVQMCLNKIAEDVVAEEPRNYDLCQIFETICNCVPEPLGNGQATIPSFVTRVILVYSRSNCLPCLYEGLDSLDYLKENPYLFLDILYVHEPVNSENKCKEIYEKLLEITTQRSYVLESGRYTTKLFENMATLLAHPLQRPLQSCIDYNIMPSETCQEVHTTNV